MNDCLIRLHRKIIVEDSDAFQKKSQPFLKDWDLGFDSTQPDNSFDSAQPDSLYSAFSLVLSAFSFCKLIS